MVSRLTNMKIIAVFEKKNENYISTKLKGGQYNIGAAGTGRSVFEKWVLAFPSKFLPQLSFSIWFRHNNDLFKGGKKIREKRPLLLFTEYKMVQAGASWLSQCIVISSLVLF